MADVKKVIKTCEVQFNIGKKSGKEYACVYIETVGGNKCQMFFSGEHKLFPAIIKSELALSDKD